MITAFFRTVLLYVLLIIGLRLTGKRQIGQLEPIEFVLMMLLSDLASVPAASALYMGYASDLFQL